MLKLSPFHSKAISCCQVCQSGELRSLLFLGFLPPVNEMLKVGSVPDIELRFPLELLRCDRCSLVQIGYEVDPQILFPHTYPYLSGSTKILKENFIDLCKEVTDLFKISKENLVIDIGANDGTLLMPFKRAGFKVLGIEPSQAADIGLKEGIPMLKDYFGKRVAQSVLEKEGLAELITAANVFAHIKEIHEVIDGVKLLLSPSGIFVSESHYLLDLVETLQYDTIYHEHLRYYSLRSLVNLFNRHGLEVIHVKRIPTHGGSIRVYAARKGVYPVDETVLESLNCEDACGLTDGSLFKSFRKRVFQSKLDLLHLIRTIKSEGKQIYGIGAPSRASTLINYAGLDESLVDAVIEVSSSHKLNKFMPGTRIPVIDEENLYKDQPEYALIFSWHIADELCKSIRNKGFIGKFITPLPTPKIR